MNKQLNTEIDRVISQLSRIDQKASMLIGINSLIMTVSISLLGIFWNDSPLWINILFITLSILNFISISINATFILWPKIEKTKGTTYFLDFKEMNVSEIYEHFDNEQYHKNLANQLIINSKIIISHIKYLKWSMRLTFLFVIDIIRFLSKPFSNIKN